MRAVNVSVPDAVREIIARNRSIYDCMKMDLINYTALAVKIQKDVEAQVDGPVNLNTIVVAIKRYADSFVEKDEVQNEPVLKNARLSLTDSFRVLTEDIDDVRKLLASFPNQKNFFQTGLAKISIHIPETQNRSDIVSYVSEILHDNGIELVNAYFGQEDRILVLHEEDAARAYKILRSEISK